MSDEVQTATQEGQTSETTRDSGEEGYQSQPDTTTNEANTQEVNDNQVDSRPDWLPQKFETPEQLAHSYKEMEGKLHTRREDFRNSIIEEMQGEANKNVPAPGDYEININVPDGMQWEADEADPMLDWFRGKASEYGLNQEEFNGLVNEYVAMDNTKGPDWNEESVELGEHAERRLERDDTWASSNLTEDAYNKFANLRADAGTVKMFEELMELNGQPKFNMTSQTSFQESLSLDDLKAMQNDPKYWKERDPAFISKVQMAFEDYTRRKEAKSNVN